jgi:hypothetical protein
MKAEENPTDLEAALAALEAAVAAFGAPPPARAETLDEVDPLAPPPAAGPAPGAEGIEAALEGPIESLREKLGPV